MNWGRGIQESISTCLWFVGLMVIGCILGASAYHYYAVAGCNEAKNELEKCRAALTKADEQFLNKEDERVWE